VQSFADGKIYRRETTAPTENGVMHLEVTASPVKDAAGNVVAGIESVRDITAQKTLEERLRQSQKMEAMGTLAGGIAHDFNNLLTPILGYSELALTRLSPNDPLAVDLQQISKAAGRAKDLVGQILAFSRRAPHEKKPFRPNLAVQEALTLLRAVLPATIEIREEISSDCGAVLADPTQLHQIIMNLCTNASHAMRHSGGVLGVSLARVDIGDDGRMSASELAPGSYVLLEISDTGCGMEQKTLTHIFEPYFTTKAKSEGSGLGLSVVHGIVKSYQGHIAVSSEPGKGTRFQVYLPRLEKTPSLAEAVCSAAIPTGTERLLVVDDEEMISTMLQMILQSLGYQVTLSGDSLEALALVEQDPMAFDLLITDLTMPHLTGFELTRKTLALRADLPIILCTGFYELLDKEQIQAMGIRAYLMKPVTVLELGQTVRTVLDGTSELS
jgi:signal transduction histidine kinase/CheY-like chemotaxis protein